MREIRMLRTRWRELETESRNGLRHRQMAKAAGNSYSPCLRPPRQLSTLLAAEVGGAIPSPTVTGRATAHVFSQAWVFPVARRSPGALDLPR